MEALSNGRCVNWILRVDRHSSVFVRLLQACQRDFDLDRGAWAGRWNKPSGGTFLGVGSVSSRTRTEGLATVGTPVTHSTR